MKHIDLITTATRKLLILSGTLFITEGASRRADSIAVMTVFICSTTASLEKYQSLWQQGRCITLQVYTDDVLTRPGLTKIGTSRYYDFEHRTAYMPWATDLLPDEINENITINALKTQRTIHWVSTIE